MKAINKLISTHMSKEDKIHLHNVSCISTLLSNYLGLSDRDMMIVSIAAGIHDIGKIQLDSDIINAERKLTADEFEHVKTHSHSSADMFMKHVSQAVDIDMALSIMKAILYHHERCDGSGYPAGISEKDIPVHAQIISVADVYDALSSKRCYKEGWSPEDVLYHFIDNTGILYSRKIVNALLYCTSDIRRLYDKRKC